MDEKAHGWRSSDRPTGKSGLLSVVGKWTDATAFGERTAVYRPAYGNDAHRIKAGMACPCLAWRAL